MHHSTVVRVLGASGVVVQKTTLRTSIADPYLAFMVETLAKYPTLRASRLYAMVRERGYPGAPDHFRAIVARMRPRPAAEAYLRRMGARTVIAVDVVYPPEEAAPRTALGVLFQAFAITVHRLKAVDSEKADLVIVPQLPRTTGQLSFGDRERLIAAGERAAQDAIEGLRRHFAPLERRP